MRLDVVGGNLVAHDVLFQRRVGLVAGHGGGAVFQDDVGDVLLLGDGVGDGELAGVEERAIAHEDDLLVGDERIDARAGAAAQAHAAVVVHERLVGLEHQHGVAAGVAVGDQIHRRLAVDAASCTAGRGGSCGFPAGRWRNRGAGSPGNRPACGRARRP